MYAIIIFFGGNEMDYIDNSESLISNNDKIYGSEAYMFYKEYYKNNTSKSTANVSYEKCTEDPLTLSGKIREPLISVIVPTFNRRKMLSKAINSVLNQEYNNIEIIIINDHSTDDTKEYLEELVKKNNNITVINNAENHNAGYNRNLGYKKSNGEFIIFLDDDDYYIDNKFFLKAISIHLKFKNLSFVGANAFVEDIKENRLIVDNINISGLISNIYYLNNFQLNYRKPHSTFTALFKKKVLEKLDFENMLMMNDSSIYLRSLLINDAYILKNIIGVYLVHESNISKSLNVDFVIMNLNEKIWVKKEAQKRDLLLHESWLSHQIILTLRYFITGSHPQFSDITKIIKWISKNIKNEKMYLCVKIIKMYLKTKMQIINYGSVGNAIKKRV